MLLDFLSNVASRLTEDRKEKIFVAARAAIDGEIETHPVDGTHSTLERFRFQTATPGALRAAALRTCVQLRAPNASKTVIGDLLTQGFLDEDAVARRMACWCVSDLHVRAKHLEMLLITACQDNHVIVSVAAIATVTNLVAQGRSLVRVDLLIALATRAMGSNQAQIRELAARLAVQLVDRTKGQQRKRVLWIIKSAGQDPHFSVREPTFGTADAVAIDSFPPLGLGAAKN